MTTPKAMNTQTIGKKIIEHIQEHRLCTIAKEVVYSEEPGSVHISNDITWAETAVEQLDAVIERYVQQRLMAVEGLVNLSSRFLVARLSVSTAGDPTVLSLLAVETAKKLIEEANRVQKDLVVS